MFGLGSPLDEHHIYSDHTMDCGDGMVHIGNRCVPAQSIVGDDHQTAGHHFRAHTGGDHYYFSNQEATGDEQTKPAKPSAFSAYEEAGDDDYPFADNPDDEPQDSESDVSDQESEDEKPQLKPVKPAQPTKDVEKQGD